MVSLKNTFHFRGIITRKHPQTSYIPTLKDGIGGWNSNSKYGEPVSLFLGRLEKWLVGARPSRLRGGNRDLPSNVGTRKAKRRTRLTGGGGGPARPVSFKGTGSPSGSMLIGRRVDYLWTTVAVRFHVNWWEDHLMTVDHFDLSTPVY